MIVLPNRLERYINALRIFTSLSVARHGLEPRHVKNLAKIHLCEAFLFENEKQITALKLLSHNLLSSVRTLKPEFDFSLEIYGNVIISKPLYIILLILLSNDTDSLKIALKNGILIRGKGEIKNSLSVIKHLKGVSFFDVKTKEYLIFLPCEKTENPPINTESQWNFLYDRFSPLKLFLK